jgi:hypothetical protein
MKISLSTGSSEILDELLADKPVIVENKIKPVVALKVVKQKPVKQ